MSSHYQFPPSSPLRSVEEESDPFATKRGLSEEVRGRNAYPTPNPSSSIFRSSSPVADVEASSNFNFHKEPVVAAKQKKVTFVDDGPFARVKINTDFNVLNPDTSVTRVPLLENQNKIILGRSSKSCDFYFGSSDKNVSRSHVSVCYNSEQLVLTCLGRNGLAIRIPRPCYVFATNSKDNYIVTENTSGTPLLSEELKESHKSIRLDANHTEFTLNKSETITLPRFNNILLEINQHIMLLNPLDEEEDLTDEEMPTLITETTDEYVTPIKAPLESFPSPRTPFKNTTKLVEITKSNEVTPSKAPLVKPQAVEPEVVKPEAAKLQEPKPEVAKPEILKPEVAKPSVVKPILAAPIPTKFKIFEDAPAVVDVPVEIKRQSTPLNDKSNTFSTPSTPKRKAQSEEPQPKNKKKKKAEISQKVDIDQEWIEGLENIPEINNILINHLAFSRLSSTPASFLKTISVLTSNLSLRQIRVLLDNIKCIGVIYRQGKDAAGKPLEEEYYYMPENDIDSHRTGLVASIKGHGGLRSCRRTHKQYYWKKPAPIKK